MKTHGAETAQEAADNEADQWLDVVRKHVGSLSFGVVQITVHDSKVVQIEKTEKTRFQPGKRNSTGG